jgi:spermidine synthase
MASPALLGAIYLLFFLSGATALVYQIVWVRSLTLVFGGSHLAVTVVLSIFMAGLAVGGYVVGRYADHVRKPLRLYGLLELGIALFAFAFVGLMSVYPTIYVALAQGMEDSVVFLSAVRILFSAVALIVPTALMGGTLPVLSRFVARQPKTLRSHLAFLYGFNTLGAVVGAALAGFILLRLYSVSAVLHLAVAANVFIGLASLVLQMATPAAFEAGPTAPAETGSRTAEDQRVSTTPATADDALAQTLILWGIGLSGFCALGYEVLWTRILTIAIGASVYSFTVMLVAFLAGIALGSQAYGVALKTLGARDAGAKGAILWFGIVQVVIGLAALLVTIQLRDIPANTVRLQGLVLSFGISPFVARVWSGFGLAFLYMIVPAFFMGVAFPLAGEVRARYRNAVGRGVGEVVAYNTVGAIFGAGMSGFVLIYLFGIERSLQMLTVVNVGLGLLVLCSLRHRRWLGASTAVLILAALAFLALNHTALRLWDTKYFAIFRSNQPEAFRTPEMVREAVENTDVLYYAEGIESIVSSIKIKGGEQSFLTNGRVEASSHLQAQQVQFTLGHLPMLLHRDPKTALVVGLGSGMTLGAVSTHPSLERVTLVELEPRVLGITRTFADYNHNVLDNPKLKIVFNDGRNFLMTTTERFDVITADPIHPWFRGAGYLYTKEYFKLAADHLRPGGLVSQWLPIYELTPRDLQSVVRTFQDQFKYTLLWLTHYDAELVGSNSQIVIDEAELERRIAHPAIAGDLQRVMMGSATDFLSYYVMGTERMKRFGQGGVLNTDDNLYLEFSAPFSIATPSVMEENVKALSAFRESLVPYLAAPTDEKARQAQRERWDTQHEAGRVADLALALLLGGKIGSPEFGRLLGELEARYSRYAPGRFLQREYRSLLAMEPRTLSTLPLALLSEAGERLVVELSAVLVPISPSRASIMFVDNRAKVVYGQRYVSDYAQGDVVQRLVDQVMTAVQETYRKEARFAASQQKTFPVAASTLQKIRDVVGARIQAVSIHP